MRWHFQGLFPTKRFFVLVCSLLPQTKMAVPTIQVYYADGRIMYKDAPIWFDAKLAFSDRKIVSIVRGCGLMANMFSCYRVNRDPFYMLKTPYGPLALDLSALPCEPKRN